MGWKLSTLSWFGGMPPPPDWRLHRCEKIVTVCIYRAINMASPILWHHRYWMKRAESNLNFPLGSAVASMNESDGIIL